MTPCIHAGNITICFPRICAMRLRVHRCPTCKCLRRFLAEHEEWYGWRETCLTCGDEWQDGEMSERPMMRGWRAKHVALTKEHWKAWQKIHPRPGVTGSEQNA